MSCIITKAGHTLEDIHDSGENSYGIRRIVRWCSSCGAIVRDVEVDGGLRPGGAMPMRFPSIALKAARAHGIGSDDAR